VEGGCTRILALDGLASGDEGRGAFIVRLDELILLRIAAGGARPGSCRAVGCAGGTAMRAPHDSLRLKQTKQE